MYSTCKYQKQLPRDTVKKLPYLKRDPDASDSLRIL